MERKQIVIIGYDAISPLGCDLETAWQRARAGESGIDHLTRFPLDPDFPVRIAGQIPDDLEDADYPFLSARHQAAWFSPIYKYGMLSVARAMERSGLVIDKGLAPRVAVTYSSAVGGLDAVLHADRRLVSAKKLPHPYTNPNSCINMIGGKIAMQTGAQGPICSTITACATGLTSILIAAMLIEQGRADVAICGAVDCPLVEPITAGFFTMNGVYSPKEGQEDQPPASASRPFSRNRRGFVVSEGAGAVIISAKTFADSHGLGYATELAGWAMTSDAHHFVTPYLETISRCMHDAIVDAALGPDDIDAINAHATSTRIGDKVEFEAIKRIFRQKIPPVSANKSQLGHPMGAASVIETIFALRGMEEGVVLPTINYQADPELPLDCVAEGTRTLAQQHLLKNSFGFGGCNACAVFRRLG
jgi:3-oxoacyl-[acyl-carrier-protein] synthase II